MRYRILIPRDGTDMLFLDHPRNIPYPCGGTNVPKIDAANFSIPSDFILPNDSHLAVAFEAAVVASRIVLDYFVKGVEMRAKESSNLVSDADVEAERAIARIITQHFPTHAIMGEEELQASVESEHLWIIDPLDGTNNFAHHIPHFAVSIAYYFRGVARCGVVVNPVRNDWYWAVAGGKAYYNGEQLCVSTASRLDQAMIGVGFYYDRGAMMEATLAAIRDFFHQQIHGVRRFGTAALDLCQVAAGMFGAYFEYQLSPWDFAAGRLILEEAAVESLRDWENRYRWKKPVSWPATRNFMPQHSQSCPSTTSSSVALSTEY